MTATVKCLVCEDPMSIPNDAEKGEVVACDSCGQDHEIVETGESAKLDLAPEIEEDWGE